ncbi:hypothetical protein [Amycolatopsis taiwanensis]|uniref:hypothetical protein n=1 Tax=Amycolatopsis taiwanensis TaxID=342230 RepID=UPI000488BFCC|nr:hypothetical protein [Amycolatopsis taiwanensis]
MEHEARLRHASSFGAAAVAYAEHRPDYAPAAVRWSPRPDPRVLDLGAGTGKLRQRRTADSLVATLATRAGVLVMSEQEREATLGRIHAFLASRPETASGEFALPMLTGVLRVRQLGKPSTTQS